MPHRSFVSRLALLPALCAFLGAPACARAQAPVAIPDSPVGALMKQWFNAFDRADSAGLDAFTRAHLPQVNAAAMMQNRRNTGGYDLVRIISAEPSLIVFAARTRSTGMGVRGRLQLADGDPTHFATFGIQAVPPGAPLEGCTSYAAPATHGTSAADVASEEAIVTALYESISGPACVRRDWDRFRGLFAPGARLIPMVAKPGGTFGARVETPEEYSASVSTGMDDFGFSEKEIAHVGESFNGMVHRFSTYESRRMASDEKPFARGIDSIQLFNDGKRWWVVTVYWAGERPGTTIPEVYLRRP